MIEEYEEVEDSHPQEKKESKIKHLHTERMILINRIEYLNEHAHFESLIDRYFQIERTEKEKKFIECQIQLELSSTYLKECPF